MMSNEPEHDLYETDASYVEAWEQWALKEQWRKYLDTMPADTRRYSAQYVEEAIKHGTLHTLWLPPSDPL